MLRIWISNNNRIYLGYGILPILTDLLNIYPYDRKANFIQVLAEISFLLHMAVVPCKMGRTVAITQKIFLTTFWYQQMNKILLQLLQVYDF